MGGADAAEGGTNDAAADEAEGEADDEVVIGMVRAKEAAAAGATTGGMGRAGVSGRDGVVVRGGATDDGAADGEKAGAADDGEKAGMEGERGGEATE